MAKDRENSGRQLSFYRRALGSNHSTPDEEFGQVEAIQITGNNGKAGSVIIDGEVLNKKDTTLVSESLSSLRSAEEEGETLSEPKVYVRGGRIVTKSGDEVHKGLKGLKQRATAGSDLQELHLIAQGLRKEGKL
jgi:hypothetical protein